MTPTVEVPDTELVFDVVIDRLLELPIDEHLPIYIYRLQHLERQVEQLRS